MRSAASVHDIISNALWRVMCRSCHAPSTTWYGHLQPPIIAPAGAMDGPIWRVAGLVGLARDFSPFSRRILRAFVVDAGSREALAASDLILNLISGN